MALTSLFNRVLPAGQGVLPSPTRRAGYGSKMAQDREAHARQSIFIAMMQVQHRNVHS
ncbi:hypothetical protein N5D37_07575 [Comamonas aquatica]|uniref:hypothetical protein n=1 Tax=Comamonas aquatica TaxID=225991 RepID=UPI002448EF5F|nr:hypothetical protein [Comamonas aquatica]MDH1765539.1 hypothetical protein [Comamonas aquatica]